MATESDAGGFSLQADYRENRPIFTLGYHDSKRETPLSELQYGYLLNQDASELMIPHGLFLNTNRGLVFCGYYAHH